MKKILAVILSLAMILSMTVVGFAAEVPATDAGVDAWTAYYTEIYLDETLDADAKADALMNADLILSNPAVAIEAMEAARVVAAEAGVDVDEVTFAMMDKMEEEYGINIEDMMGEDIDGDGYIGANKKPVDPTDVEGWTAYYALLLGDAATDPSSMTDVVAEIAGDITSGAIDMDTFTSVLPEAANIVGNDVVNQVVWGVESLLNMDLNSDGYTGKPDGSIDDGQLPEEDDSEGGSGGFLSGLLDTVLGILGTIGDLLFGGSSSGGSTSTEPSDDDNLWGDDSGDMWGDDSSSTIPDTGDTTVFAVAAVALAAGAALVMTRKKSEDAE